MRPIHSLRLGGASHTVLVVDDAAAIRLLCRVNLELDGHRVLEAGTLEEARDLLAAEPIEIVLLDVHVGAGNGLAFMADVRRDHPGVAVAILTGTAELESARIHHPDALISKPFELDVLTETVQRLGDRAARSV